MIGQRVERLSAPCRDLLVARLGARPRVRARRARAAERRSPAATLLELLDEAMAERVVGECPGRPGRLRFGHALIRDTLYDELTAARRLRPARARRRGARGGLRRRPRAATSPSWRTTSPPPPRPARRQGGRLRAPRRRPRGRAARLRGGGRASTRWRSRSCDDAGARCDLLLALGDAQARAGDTPAAKAPSARPPSSPSARGLAEQLARAALGYGGRIIWEVSRDDEHLVPLLERALAALGDDDSPLRVRLLARLAGGPLRDAQLPARAPARALSEEALDARAAARRPGRRSPTRFQGYIPGHHSPEHTRAQLELGDRADRDRARGPATTSASLEGHEERARRAARARRRSPGRRPSSRRWRGSRSELRQPSQEWLVAVYRALLALLEGRLRRGRAADRDARARSASARRAGTPRSPTASSCTCCAASRAGSTRSRTLVRRSLDEYPTYPIWRCVLAHMAAELGHADEARERARRARRPTTSRRCRSTRSGS